MNMKVLVVEDENDIARSVAYALEKESFSTRIAPNGQSALTEARSWQPDVILLDLLLPDIDGFSVCRVLQQSCKAAIIMVTARTSEVDRVVGLEIGADDYICKPFSTRELIARVRAVLRRAHGPEHTEANFVSGNIELQCEARKVFLEETPVEMTLKEFELLKILMRNRGRVMPREFLYEAVWEEALPIDTRTLDAHIHTLREKIEKDPTAPQRIITVRGVGYRFEG